MEIPEWLGLKRVIEVAFPETLKGLAHLAEDPKSSSSPDIVAVSRLVASVGEMAHGCDTHTITGANGQDVGDAG